jgi:hypothetical protein
MVSPQKESLSWKDRQPGRWENGKRVKKAKKEAHLYAWVDAGSSAQHTYEAKAMASPAQFPGCPSQGVDLDFFGE